MENKKEKTSEEMKRSELRKNYALLAMCFVWCIVLTVLYFLNLLIFADFVSDLIVMVVPIMILLTNIKRINWLYSIIS